MKKMFLFLALSLFANMTYAQLLKNGSSNDKKQSDLDWFNCSFDKDGIYGAEVNKAYDFLKDKKIKKRPVVAIIGTGLDIEHEDLKDAIWKNPKEKKINGKDNDKNGYIDDIHGWNFLGGKDGTVMEKTMEEGDREFIRLFDKGYGKYFYDGENFYQMINDKKTKVPAPDNMNEYRYYVNRVLSESRIAGSYGGYQLSYLIRDYGKHFDRMMRAKYPNQELTQKEFGICYDPKAAKRDSLSEVAFMIYIMGFTVSQTDSWDVVHNAIKSGDQITMAKEEYEKAMQQYGNDGRKEIVGDNYLDLNDYKYGNNVLLTSDAFAGTMLGGIIAANRENDWGMNGIMDKAELMTLRVKANEGEPYLKDVVLAIRYAVDNHADIIMLPQQATLYPDNQKKWVDEALKYAESKGVLVVVPTREYSVDMAKMEFYPNRWMTGEKELTNLMIVASSDKNGNPSMSSNYGAKEVDLFAPGTDVYSSYTGDTYQKASGAGLAAAATVGVAALIKAYYPELSGSQIRNLLIKSVTSRADAEVEKGIRVKDRVTQDLFLFGDLCLSKGILNAYNAVIAADKMSNQ